MPTNLKRVQVLLRPEVMAAVENLSQEEDTTMSKTCARLVEEALEQRGLIDRSKIERPTRWKSQTVAKKSTPKDEVEVLSEVSPEDLALLKKLKLLKELGI